VGTGSRIIAGFLRLTLRLSAQKVAYIILPKYHILKLAFIDIKYRAVHIRLLVFAVLNPDFIVAVGYVDYIAIFEISAVFTS
jgi:hypothetical protein